MQYNKLKNYIKESLIAIRAGRYIEFVRYINIFSINDTVWGNTVYIAIQ